MVIMAVASFVEKVRDITKIELTISKQLEGHGVDLTCNQGIAIIPNANNILVVIPVDDREETFSLILCQLKKVKLTDRIKDRIT